MTASVAIAAMITATGASAAPTTAADEAASLIADVAPPAQVVDLSPSADGAHASVTIDDTDASVPLAADGRIVLGSNHEVPLVIPLPEEVTPMRTSLAHDGTVLFETSSSTDAAVQVLGDGSVRVQTITHDAPRTGVLNYTYTFEDGVYPFETPDGIVLLQEAGDGLALEVGTVAPAWAVDAEGGSVPTDYIVVGNSLIQTVTPSEETQYPIVADPTYGHSYGVPTVYLTKKETSKAQDADGANIMCGVVALWNAPVGLLCAANVTSIARAAKKAVNERGCLKIAVGPLVTSSYTFFANCK